MRVTPRDGRLIKDAALSHVLSRDQVIDLGYFDSVTRTNTRVRGLIQLGLLRRIDTPFFAQSLYAVGPKADVVVGERIARIVAGRVHSPRFLQHALCTTNVRIALIKKGAIGWRFEQQLRSCFEFRGKSYAVRPDGMAVFPNGVVAVEVDLGHVAPAKFQEKLLGYSAFVASGECSRQWKEPTFSVLVVTTGKLRASRLSKLAPAKAGFEYECLVFDRLGISFAGSWS